MKQILILCALLTLASCKREHPVVSPAPEVERELGKNYDYFDDNTLPVYRPQASTNPSGVRISETARMRMVRTRDLTYVIITYTAGGDWWLYYFDKEAYILDNRTCDRYMIRAVQHYPLNHLFWVRGLKDKEMSFVLEFPPLPESVKNIDFIEPATPPRDWWMGGEGTHYADLSVEELCSYDNDREAKVIR